MAEIKAGMVKELREATGLGMMECKRALQEAGGDSEAAIKLLRERGAVVAGKKAGRTAKEGLVSARVAEEGVVGTILEVNSETDFVARNEKFQAFVAALTGRALECGDGQLADAVKEEVVAKIQEIGENLVVRRNLRFQKEETGRLGSYVHLGGKVAVLVEVGCGKEETVADPVMAETVKDLTLHIAACHPQYLDREAVPEAVIAAEREIYAKQVENKPAPIVEKIVDGKLGKFFSQDTLLEQPFVKDSDRSVSRWLADQSKALGDTLTVRRFARFQVGEEQ